MILVPAVREASSGRSRCTREVRSSQSSEWQMWEKRFTEMLASQSNQKETTNSWRRSIAGRTEAGTRAMRRPCPFVQI